MDFSQVFCPPANPSLPSVSCARLSHEYQETCRQLDTLSQCSPSPDVSRDRVVLLYNRATLLYELGNFEDSLRDLNTALATRSSGDVDPDMLNLRSLVYCALGSFDLSLDDINQAIHLSEGVCIPCPSSEFCHIFYNTRGVLYHKYLENHQMAEKDLSEAIARSWMDPSSTAQYYNHRGIVRMDLKKWVESLDDFEAAIRLDPTLVLAYVNRAKLRLLVGSVEDPDQVILRRFRRRTESMLDAAERDLVFASEILGSQKWIMWNNLGMVKLLKCQPTFAVSCFRKALQALGCASASGSDKHSEMLVRYRLAIGLKYEGKLEEAREECLRVLDGIQDPSRIIPKSIRAVGSGSRCERIFDDIVAGPRENLKRLQAVLLHDVHPTAVNDPESSCPSDQTTRSIVSSRVIPSSPRDETIARPPTLPGHCKSPQTIPSQPSDLDVRPSLPGMRHHSLQGFNAEQVELSPSLVATSGTEEDALDESRKRKRLVQTAREFGPSKRRKIVDLVTGGTKAVPSPRNDDAE